MKTLQQLCIESVGIAAKNGDHCILRQGEYYMTSVPSEDSEDVTVFTNFWVKAPKKCFVPAEGWTAR